MVEALMGLRPCSPSGPAAPRQGVAATLWLGNKCDRFNAHPLAGTCAATVAAGAAARRQRSDQGAASVVPVPKGSRRGPRRVCHSAAGQLGISVSGRLGLFPKRDRVPPIRPSIVPGSRRLA